MIASPETSSTTNLCHWTDLLDEIFLSGNSPVYDADERIPNYIDHTPVSFIEKIHHWSRARAMRKVNIVSHSL